MRNVKEEKAGSKSTVAAALAVSPLKQRLSKALLEFSSQLQTESSDSGGALVQVGRYAINLMHVHKRMAMPPPSTHMHYEATAYKSLKKLFI